MARTAGRNGRLAGAGAAAAVADDRPACDAAYRRLVDDLLATLPMGDDEDLADAVARRFREGPARACSRAIGEWIEGKLAERGWSQEDLARRVGVDRSAVARWTAGGSISLAHLVVALVELRGSFAELPFPARHELTVEAYLAALAYVRDRLLLGAGAASAAGIRTLDRERFWCLYHLLSEPHWERAIRARDGARLEAEARRVIDRAGESLGHRPWRVEGVEALRQLVEDWAVAWAVCLRLVPGGWSLR